MLLRVLTAMKLNRQWIKFGYNYTNANVTVGNYVYTTKVKLNPMVYGVGIGYRFF